MLSKIVISCVMLIAACCYASDQISEDSFDVLMGLNTKHWHHVTQEKDLEALQKFKTIFYEKEPLLKKNTSNFKIPKVVHFIWLGPKPFPPKSVANVRSWMAHHPDWTFKFWTDRDREPPCHGMQVIVFKEYPLPELKRFYSDSANWGEKSDLLRYEILWSEGGLYVDHDVVCKAPIDCYHKAYHFFSGLEPPHELVSGRNITAGNGVIGSVPSHPIIRRAIDLTAERWDVLKAKHEENENLSKTLLVMERTFTAFTDAVLSEIGQTNLDDIILPAAYFHAKKGLSPILGKHLFAGEWTEINDMKFKQKIISQVKEISRAYNSLALFQIAALSLNLILLIIGIFLFRKRGYNEKI